MMSPPTSVANTGSRLPNCPRPEMTATSPDAPPSQFATVLPEPERLMRPSSRPTLLPVVSSFGNSRASCMARASSDARMSAGFFEPSMRIAPLSLPPATPRSSGSSVSTPSTSFTCTLPRSSGTSRTLRMRSAVYFTSAFMARRRSKSSGAVGSTLPPGRLTWVTVGGGATPSTVAAVRAVGGRPISGPRSSMSITLERRSPARCGSLPDWSKRMSPAMSDRPSRPLRPEASHSLPRLSSLPLRVYGDVCGSAMPSSGNRAPSVWPLMSNLASMPSRSDSRATVPAAFSCVWPAAARISIGKGGAFVVSICSTLPVRPLAVSGWPL